MKFLLDMGITPKGVGLLRSLHHLAHRCGEFGLATALDKDLVEFARKNGFTLVTTDKRFGDIVMLSGRGEPGVVILRLGNATFAEMLRALERLMESCTEIQIKRSITTIEPHKLRRHSLEPE